MADKEISMLPESSGVSDDTVIPVYQPGALTPAQKMTGAQFRRFAIEAVQPQVDDAKKFAEAAAESAKSINAEAVKAHGEELEDARVGHDGKTYGSAGEAVRTQVSALNGDYIDLKKRVFGTKKETTTETVTTEGEYKKAYFSKPIPVGAVIQAAPSDFFFYYVKSDGNLVSSYDVVVPYAVTEALHGVAALAPREISITYEIGEDVSGALDNKQDKLIAGEGIEISPDGRTISVSGNGGSVDELRFELFGTEKETTTETVTTEGEYKKAYFDSPIPVGAVITKKESGTAFYFVKENGSLLPESDVQPPFTVTEVFVGVSSLAAYKISITYEIGENVDGAFDNTRQIIKVRRNDDDVTVFEKMRLAYMRGHTDVIFEPSTYVLSDVYDHIRNNTDMAKALPVGNNCRYFFNGSTLISNPPSDGYSDARNILDCQNKANTYEIHDCVLINNGGRYCIHDEGAGDVTPYTHLYRNVKMIYNRTDFTPDGGCKAFGCGIGHTTNINFENCQFINDGQNTVPVAIHNVPARKGEVVFNLSMVNCYLNQYTIDLANFDKTQDKLNFYLFGNLWGAEFTDGTPFTIANNNNVIT